MLIIPEGRELSCEHHGDGDRRIEVSPGNPGESGSQHRGRKTGRQRCVDLEIKFLLSFSIAMTSRKFSVKQFIIYLITSNLKAIFFSNIET